jgi:hypothetical protein
MPMRTLTAVVAWACLATVLGAQAPTEKGRLGLSLAELTKPWTGDLDGMVERRTVRVLTAYSYNAGPGRVRQLRREAEARGLDPNVWFNNVERIASERIGRETVTYVSNIYKYYVTYLLIQGEYMQRQTVKKDDRR